MAAKWYLIFLSASEGSSVVCLGKFATVAQAQQTADDLKKKGFDGTAGTW